jgi:arylesterase/paraoxonase
LVAQGTVEGGLLTDPQDVAAAGPGAFYVSNNSAKQALVKALAGWGVLPASEILYFNGMSFKPVMQDLYDVRGLVMAPDGNHLLAASLTARSLKSFSRDPFSGNLTEADSLTLPVAPEKISLDAMGQAWVAGHASLVRWRDFAADPKKPAPSQVFRVNLISGAPRDAPQVYGNDGSEIGGAGIAASSGKRLLIGSSLDGKLLECTQP